MDHLQRATYGYAEQTPLLYVPATTTAANLLERRTVFGNGTLATPIPIRAGCGGYPAAAAAAAVQLYYQNINPNLWLPFNRLYANTALHGHLSSAGNAMLYFCSKPNHPVWTEKDVCTATTGRAAVAQQTLLSAAVPKATTSIDEGSGTRAVVAGRSLLRNSVQPYRCGQCKRRFDTEAALRLHSKAHVQGSKCPICGKTFTRHWLIQGHLRTHTGEKPFKCHVCAKAFADKSNLRAHVQTHSGLKPFSCRRCGRGFALKSYLSKHEESACQNRVINMVSYRKIEQLLV